MRLLRPIAFVLLLLTVPTGAVAQGTSLPTYAAVPLVQPGITPGAFFVQPPDPHPAPEPASERLRWEAVVPGIVSFAVGYLGYLLTTIVWNGVNNTCGGSSWGLGWSCTFNGVGPDGSDIQRSLVPLVGPWWSVVESTTMRGGDLAVPVISGIAQAAGLITLVVGLVTPVTRPGADVELSVGPGSGRLAVHFD